MKHWLLFSGIGFILMAIILFRIDALKEKDKTEIKELEKASVRTELLIDELNELSSIIVEELDKKYSNMLNIYNEVITVSEPVQGESSTGTAQQRDKKDTILELHNTGKSVLEIARELGIGIGETELVIKFARRGVGTKNEKL